MQYPELDPPLAAHLARLDKEDDEREARLARPGALLGAALWYAGVGIACFPLRPGGKLPALPKAHPDDARLQSTCKRACGRDGHGLYDATTDPDRITAWWTANARYNIGTPTGHQFDVIDVDGPVGYRHLADMRDEDLIPTVYGRVHTASGGAHLYIEPTGDGNGTRLRGGKDGGIDYRGLGGYTVAPPSHSAEHDLRWTWTEPLNLKGLSSP